MILNNGVVSKGSLKWGCIETLEHQRMIQPHFIINKETSDNGLTLVGPLVGKDFPVITAGKEEHYNSMASIYHILLSIFPSNYPNDKNKIK